MIRFKVITQDPVNVRIEQVGPGEANKFSAGATFGVGRYIGPAPGEIWDDIHIQLELTTSSNKGLRFVWLYLRGTDRSLTRHQVMTEDNFMIHTHMASFRCPVSHIYCSNNSNGVIVTSTGPYYQNTLLWPSAVGVLIGGFDGGDILNMSVIAQVSRM